MARTPDNTAADDSNAAAPDTQNNGFPLPNGNEAMLFFNMIKNMSSQPDVDWDAVAADSGFKSAAVAKKRFYQIKIKLGLDQRAAASRSSRDGQNDDGASSSDVKAEDGEHAKVPPSTPTRRRKSTATGGGTDGEASPTKKARGRPRKTAAPTLPVMPKKEAVGSSDSGYADDTTKTNDDELDV